MRTSLVFSVITLCLLLAAAVFLVPAALAGRQAAPEVFSSPINASCVRVSAYECRLQVDAFTIHVASQNRLEAFQLRANGSLLYDFRTDTSNPPAGDYSPSSVALDFAATCGVTYTVSLLALDSGASGFLNAGQVEGIVCPQADPTPPAGGNGQRIYLPFSVHSSP